MQALDLPCNSSLDPRPSDSFAMSDRSSPIHRGSPREEKAHAENNDESKNNDVKSSTGDANNGVVSRRERLSRACTQRAAERLQAAAKAEAAVEADRKRKKSRRKERLTARLLREESDEEGEDEDGEEENGEKEEDGSLAPGRMVTPLLGEPEESQLPRWRIRSMWQLASILNFLNVFRPSLNIKVEFSAEEFETALISPNNTLADIHMPLLKAIPPVTRMALGHHTWITVLCRKLRDWWHWVAEGDLPIVASHGAEVETYKSLDPGMRVVILKAICDIRVEQDDIRQYMEHSMKHGVLLSTFRKEPLGGDSHGVSYWYEDDSIIGHRLYREIRKVEAKKGKGRNIPPIPDSSYQWEAVATNLDEFQTVSEKLLSSKNRTEVSVGKKLKNDMLPEIEKVHKRKEKLLKKQHRQALMLDSMISMDGLTAGRSLRDRKPVTYTFDDYDRSINEALKVTKKKQPSPEPFDRRDPHMKLEVSENGKWGGGTSSQCSQPPSSNDLTSDSPDYTQNYQLNKQETLDRSNRRRKKPQRYSEKEFVEAPSENEMDFDSDEDIVGEVVYHDEYIESRKRRKKMSSSSEGDEEYNWDEENPEEDEEDEEEEEDDEVVSTSDGSNRPQRSSRTVRGRTRRETKLRSVGELQSGLRRSKRTTRNRINYRNYEMSESDNESKKRAKSEAAVLSEHSEGSGDRADFSRGFQDSDDDDDDSDDNERNNEQEMRDDPIPDLDLDAPMEQQNSQMDHEMETNQPDLDGTNHRQQEEEDDDEEEEEEVEGVGKRRYLDLNELAPSSGFDDTPNPAEGEDRDRDGDNI
ncbi:DDT domain-containing protein DDR4-like [Andrographis paniculata]|uniref:DDT domain-containing protein DDR4-like n=1 Tax=Andrographis paniculata TaxID=175694 RepID=UPI0021E74C01|nr:DDT domain-containing protein DDR4-like [Andrographis paniculata]